VTASKWAEFPVLAFDIESTGVDTASDRIVTCALVEVPATGRPITSHFVVDPGVEIPAEAAAVHGYTRDRAAAEATHSVEQMLFEVTGRIALWLGHGKPLVTFNAAFDLSMLEAENARHGIEGLTSRLGLGKVQPVIDPMVIANYVEPYRKKVCTCRCGATDKTLTGWCLHYRVPLVGAHGAAGDALAAARLWRRIMTTRPWKFPGMTLPALHQSQVGWKKAQADQLRDWWRKQGDDRWREVDGSWPMRRTPVPAGVGVSS